MNKLFGYVRLGFGGLTRRVQSLLLRQFNASQAFDGIPTIGAGDSQQLITAVC